MGYHQAYQPIHHRNSKKEERTKRKKDFEETMGKNFLNLMKDMN